MEKHRKWHWKSKVNKNKNHFYVPIKRLKHRRHRQKLKIKHGNPTALTRRLILTKPKYNLQRYYRTQDFPRYKARKALLKTTYNQWSQILPNVMSIQGSVELAAKVNKYTYYNKRVGIYHRAAALGVNIMVE